MKIEITRNNNITDVHTPCDEIPGDIVRSPRDVEYQAFLHPEKNDLAVVGMIQPDSGQWGITDLQSQVIARMILADRKAPQAKSWLQKQGQRSSNTHFIRYIDSPRHALEIEHFNYSKRLKKLINGMNRRLRHAPV